MPKIVYLDAYTLNPGDIDFEAIARHGELICYDRSDVADLPERCKNADVLIVNKFKVDRTALDLMPSIRYVAVSATGFNNVDIDEVKRRGIPVSNVRNYGSDSVAQYVFAAMLSFYNRTDHYAREVKAARWNTCRDFCFYDHSIHDLSGRVLGIIGFGDIGHKVAQLGLAFGMNVLVHTRTIPAMKMEKLAFTDREEVFRRADVLSLHCPLTPDTDKLIDAGTLGMMKKNALLINTGRGGLINEADLYEALSGNAIAGAILDVLTVEPPQAPVLLMQLKNCMITPHIAWASVESRKNLVNGLAENINAFLSGQWINRVY